MNEDIARKVADALLDVKAVKLNVKEPFKFTSGINSPIYCDNRKVIGFPKERDVIVDAFIETLKNKEFDILAGTSTAGIPWASFIAQKLNKPMAYIRSKPKSHGTKSQIEGGDVAGKRVIVIEDLISTGGSCISSVEAVQKAGGKSVEVLAIFTYQFKKADDGFKQVNCKCETLSNFEALIKEAHEQKYIDDEDESKAVSWNKNPEEWGN